MTEGHEPAADGDAAHAGGDDAKKEDKRIAWFVRPPRSLTLASWEASACTSGMATLNITLRAPPLLQEAAEETSSLLQPSAVENVASFRVAGSCTSLALLQPA